MIVTPPRTGSTAINEALCDETDAFLVFAPQLEIPAGEPWHLGSHSAIIPAQYAHMRVALCIRNPLDRAVSSWLYQAKWLLFQNKPAPCFLDYLKSVEAGEIGRFYEWTLSDFERQINEQGYEVEKVIRLERIERDVAALIGEEVKIPRANDVLSRDRPLFHTFYGEDEQRIALKYWKEDIAKWYNDPLCKRKPDE